MYEENFILFFISVLVQLYTPWGTTRPYLSSISALIYILHSYYYSSSTSSTLLLQPSFFCSSSFLFYVHFYSYSSILSSLLSELFIYIFFTSSTASLFPFICSTFPGVSSASSALLLELFFFYFACSFTFNYSSSTLIRSSFPAAYFCFVQSSSSATLLLLEKFPLLLCRHPSFSLHPLFFSTHCIKS